MALFLALSAAACGPSPGGAGSPEELVAVLLDAARARDAGRAAALYPSPDVLARVLACPGGDDAAARIALARARVGDELGELAGLALRARDPAADRRERLEVGTDLGGCRVTASVEVLKARFTFEGRGGRTEDDTLRFVIVDGRTYLLAL